MLTTRDKITDFFSRQWILLLVFAAVILPITAIEYSVLRQTKGIFMYPLDDVYIHMALAKNLAFYHNWGINRYDFASASSSILYTLFLSGLFRLFCTQIIIPFIVNCVAGAVLLVIVQKWLRKQGIHNTPQLILLLCIVFISPVPILLICGMEHTLQCLFSFLFIFGFSDWLESNLMEKKEKWRFPGSLIVYGVLVCLIRYEGLFLIGIAGLILIFHRKVGMAFKLGCISVLPLVIFGIYSISKGSYFLPNSVLLKSEDAHLSFSGIIQYLDNILVQRLTVVRTDNLSAGTPRPGISLLATQRLLIILPLSWFLFRKFIRERMAYGYILAILTGCTLLQLAFASTGWLYRYEAYLIFCSVTMVGVLIYKYGALMIKQDGIIACLLMVVLFFGLLFPFVLRSSAAFSKTSTACINIYQQQYQMGLFLHRYYDQEVIAVNDIGAVSYLTAGRDLDLWGLGNIQVARSRKNKYYTPDFLDSLCKASHAKLAIVYQTWFSDSLLNRWTKVASWQIQNNVICGEDRVYFFAVDGIDAPVLKKNLRKFERTLPASVSVRYY
jgi:hypothetical protein